MKTIYKYELSPDCEFGIPASAKILCVQEQRSTICLWALVDTDNAQEARRFVVVPTGAPIDYDESIYRMDYLGTASLDGGVLIFHVFELIKK